MKKSATRFGVCVLVAVAVLALGYVSIQADAALIDKSSAEHVTLAM